MAAGRMRAYWTRKVGRPLVNLFRQGRRPEQIALTVALGAALSLFPVVGVTSILCLVAAVKLRLNLPAIQAVNWLLGGVQLALLLPLMRVGEWLRGAPRLGLSAEELTAAVKNHPWKSLRLLHDALFHAVLGWAVTVLPLAILAFLLLRGLLRRRRPRFVLEQGAAGAP